MISTIVNVALGAAAIYFFYQHNYIVGVLLLIVTIVRLYQGKLQRFAKALDQIAKYSDLEKKSNCFLQVTIGLEELLNHESVARLFERLQSTKTITDDLKRADWCSRLIQNYKTKYKAEQAIYQVKFNIKSNLLWKNGEIDF